MVSRYTAAAPPNAGTAPMSCPTNHPPHRTVAGGGAHHRPLEMAGCRCPPSDESGRAPAPRSRGGHSRPACRPAGGAAGCRQRRALDAAKEDALVAEIVPCGIEAAHLELIIAVV